MTSKIILEAVGTLFLIYMLIHEQELIAFEQNAARKLRRTVNRIKYQIHEAAQDAKAIRRACRRQNITARELWRRLNEK